MNFEPVKQFWIEPSREELAAANHRLMVLLVLAFVLAASGWGLFIWGILQ
jgi:hypothetical protein